MNHMMISEEVVPLRQDCKTLTVVNNIRSILDEAHNLDCINGDIDMLATDARNLQEYLQDVCYKVFSALNIETECTVVLNEYPHDDQSNSEISSISTLSF